MHAIRAAYCFVAFFIAILAVNPASTQSGPQKVSQTSGITASIARMNIFVNRIVIQFQLTNNTKGRVYIAITSDPLRNILTSSGETLPYPRENGIKLCQANLRGCIAMPHKIDDLSYIEPGDTINFGLSWNSPRQLQPSDAISFILPLVAVYAKSGDAYDVGPPRGVQFNFSNTPVHPD